MKSYQIIRVSDPYPYKNQIIEFWRIYLHEKTPARRLNWLMEGNPAGPAIWFLAFTEAEKVLCGTICLLPKVIFQNGKKFHGAILGDLMVAKSHRVFGPALKLVKTAVECVKTNEFDFIYTIPNLDSLKLINRAGLRNTMPLSCYVRPIYFQYYFKKHMPDIFAHILSPLVGIGLNLLISLRLLVHNGTIEELSFPDETLETIWEQKKGATQRPIADHRLSYLKWRYHDNPLNNFRVLLFLKKSTNNYRGFVIFRAEERKMTVYDIVTLHENDIDPLLSALIRIARQEECQAIYLTVPRNGKISFKLKNHFFVDAKEQMQLCWTAREDLLLEHWDFFQGDRNI